MLRVAILSFAMLSVDEVRCAILCDVMLNSFMLGVVSALDLQGLEQHNFPYC
jgi:hypothetical protein